VIPSPILKRIGLFAIIGVCKRKIGKEKESKNEEHGEGQKLSGTWKKKSRGAFGHGREKIM
jgi:hypothetical protein